MGTIAASISTALVAATLFGATDGGEAPDPDRIEVAVLPSASYSTDMGVGLGALLSLAKYDEGFRPYRWRLKVTGFMTVRPGPDGPELPIYAGYVMLDLPNLDGKGLRLNVRAVLRRALADYYGIGNATSALVPPVPPPLDGFVGTDRFHQYRRTWAALKLGVRKPLMKALHLYAEAAYSYNSISPFSGSKLSQDAAGANGNWLRGALAGLAGHGVFQLRLAAVWDSRDREAAPESGMFHELTVHSGTGDDRITYGGVQASLRFYQALGTRHLVLAARVVADVIGGRMAFYDLPLIGSYSTVRGVPWRRFHGKGRVFGNLELRARFLPFTLFEQHFELGAVAFVDSGRVWACLEGHPELDGDGHGLKLGTGGGLRLHWGESFVVRADGAWSPDGHGFYIGGGHLF